VGVAKGRGSFRRIFLQDSFLMRLRASERLSVQFFVLWHCVFETLTCPPPLSTGINLRRVEKGPTMTEDSQGLKSAENHCFSFSVDNFELSPESIS
jgi:hypothetical protein